MEKHSRTIFKTLSWRIIATSTTLTIVYIFTNDFVLSAGVGGFETIAKIILYYLHERMWNKSNFGRKISSLPTLKSPPLSVSILKNAKNHKDNNP